MIENNLHVFFFMNECHTFLNKNVSLKTLSKGQKKAREMIEKLINRLKKGINLSLP